MPLLSSLIESGFDILNPVQWSAVNMDRRTLKQKFGSDLVFWGGGVNTQTTLPFGTEEDVRREVLECCEVFSKDGGFVFNTIHNITADVPVENIAAMAEAVKEFNGER
jgi:uroporphyrinogen-III decarboxylase